MRRPYLGIGILLTLLILGSLIWWGMEQIHSDIGQLLTQAQAAAEADQWQKAQSFSQQAQQLWQRHHHFTAAFADHTPMDELDGLFAELLIFSAKQESPHFESTCARLIQATRSMADSHGIQWWNIL